MHGNEQSVRKGLNSLRMPPRRTELGQPRTALQPKREHFVTACWRHPAVNHTALFEYKRKIPAKTLAVVQRGVPQLENFACWIWTTTASLKKTRQNHPKIWKPTKTVNFCKSWQKPRFTKNWPFVQGCRRTTKAAPKCQSNLYEQWAFQKT